MEGLDGGVAGGKASNRGLTSVDHDVAPEAWPTFSRSARNIELVWIVQAKREDKYAVGVEGELLILQFFRNWEGLTPNRSLKQRAKWL